MIEQDESPSREPVRVGIVGCGSVLDSYGAMLRILSANGFAQVVAASDVDPAREANARARFGEVRFTTDHEQLVGFDEVELVLVITSPASHGTVAIAGLEAGKHVLVEKPMAPTLEEAARMLDLAQAGPGFLVCAPHTILSPTFSIIWKRLRADEIGKVCLARARYGEAGLTWGPWRYDGSPGGGPLLECGVYNVATLTGLLGPAIRVFAMGGAAIPFHEMARNVVVPTKGIDNIQVLVDFGESRFATLATGYTMWGTRSPAIELYGSEGVIQMLGEDWAPEGYEILQPKRSAAWQTYAEADPGWHWTDGLRHLIECIHRGETPLETPEHAYHVLEIMVKAEDAARDGEARPIDSSFSDLRIDAAAIDAEADYWRPITVSR